MAKRRTVHFYFEHGSIDDHSRSSGLPRHPRRQGGRKVVYHGYGGGKKARVRAARAANPNWLRRSAKRMGWY
jgi:hypothetical protein